MINKKLPKGIEIFSEIREKDYYYVDKTLLIRELLNDGAKVSLFTRPRRFGKTLNLSMLQSFFEVGTDPTLFEGLAISEEKELCEQHMGKYPVIFISLKALEGKTYEDFCDRMWSILRDEASRFDSIRESFRLSEDDKIDLQRLRRGTGELEEGLKMLSKLLCKHYGRKVILLIDEYNVPLDKASRDPELYQDVLLLIRSMLGSALKTNPYLEFAVLTGCLRVSKESIFTGINNFSVNDIVGEIYDEYFGFTDEEVIALLSAYDAIEQYKVAKEWYDGYRFGKQDVYCPWDMICYTRELRYNSKSLPQNFWANTSGNDIIRRFADKAQNSDTRDELAQLIDGGTLQKKINMELTYGQLDGTIDNLWSVLFTTGYLTHRGRNEDGSYNLTIPNREVREIFKQEMDDWFKQRVLEDEDGLKEFFEALENEDANLLETCLLEYLENSVSYLDGGQIKDKENFYHGLLLGMLQGRKGWDVKSNREAGDGRPDIVIAPHRQQHAMILEVKYTTKDEELETVAYEALRQIEERNYDAYFGRRKKDRIVHYGIAFCKKNCCVMKSCVN